MPGSPAASRSTSTTVCSAMPPRMFPTAMPSWWVRAALTTIAISGRFVTIASRMSPPNASPRPSLTSSTSVARTSLVPAIHTAAPAATKMASNTGSGSPFTRPTSSSPEEPHAVAIRSAIQADVEPGGDPGGLSACSPPSRQLRPRRRSLRSIACALIPWDTLMHLPARSGFGLRGWTSTCQPWSPSSRLGSAPSTRGRTAGSIVQSLRGRPGAVDHAVRFGRRHRCRDVPES